MLASKHLEEALAPSAIRGAIRALAHDSLIQSIADVLGHRYIDTTFIYAKADLNSLREVAMPWPGKERIWQPVFFAVRSHPDSRRSWKLAALETAGVA